MAVQKQSSTVKDFLEGVGKGLKLKEPPLPLLAMPTTAGTGTEATKNAVISSYDPPFKKSLRDARMVPRIALVDPELTVSTPPEITAASGMDAITQLFESYVTRKRQPITCALATQGLEMALPAICQAVDQGDCRWARERMAHAAMLSGICLANAGLGMAHGVAPALGVHARVPHGKACALMLPVTLNTNAEVCRAAYAELGRKLLPMDPSAGEEEIVKKLIDHVETLCRKIGVPMRLSEVGVSREQIPDLVAGSRGNSMRGNPREISDEELTQLLESIVS
jgi:alcohol dehydrogenase class IV